MSNAQEAIDFVLVNEGGLANVPGDAGGITNLGISFRFLNSLSRITLNKLGLSLPITADTIRSLTNHKEIAEQIYETLFWAKQPYGQIASQRLCNYIFDCGVAMGIGTGVEVAQRGCNLLLGAFPISVDGVLGDETLKALNTIEEDQLLAALPKARARVYQAIVMNNPGDHQFLNGWLKRAQRI